MYVAGMLTIIAVAGALIIWGQSSKGPMGDPGPPGPRSTRRCRPTEHNIRHSDRSLKLR
jgi:hypothetical protein